VSTRTRPGVLAQQGQPVPPPSSASSFWYYCADAKMYYPYVRQCPTGWLKVVPKTGPPRALHLSSFSALTPISRIFVPRGFSR